MTAGGDALERVRTHYQTYAAEELQRLAKDRYARIEFEVTWRFIEETLAPGSRVLDAGSGPGRYAVALAQEGHRVSLLDLSPHCLELAREWGAVAGVDHRFEAVEEGDVRDLSRWPDGHFDAVLLLGPLYHLLTARERGRCVSEVRRVLPRSPGGGRPPPLRRPARRRLSGAGTRGALSRPSRWWP